MTYPAGQTFNVRDGGVGNVSSGDIPPLVVGVSSSGTVATLYDYSDPNELLDDLGQGPGPECSLDMLAVRGRVLFLKLTATTAGAAGAVTKTAIGSSTGTITVAGAAYDAYLVRIEITLTGTVGVGKFRYTLDRSAPDPTWSEEILIPAGGTFAVPNTNLTLTFVPGAGTPFFEDGDLHAFDCTAPQYTTTDLSAGITALLAALGSRKLKDIYFTGRSVSASAAATMAAAIATHLATLEAAHYFTRGMMDAGNDTSANVITAYVAAFSDERVAACFGTADVLTRNANPGWGAPRRPTLHVFAERAAGADLSENLGRIASGPLRGVVAITNDEGVSTAFTEAHKINTLRTHRGNDGFFCTNGYLRSAAGSDFLYWDWGLTLDEACRVVYDVHQTWLLKKVRVKRDGTGQIDDRDAVRIETAVRQALSAALMQPTNVEGFKGHVSAFSYTVDRENDVLSTKELRSSLSMIPLPPIEGITTDLGFTRSVA